MDAMHVVLSTMQSRRLKVLLNISSQVTEGTFSPMLWRDSDPVSRCSFGEKSVRIVLFMIDFKNYGMTPMHVRVRL
jgi:hypothetical protein